MSTKQDVVHVEDAARARLPTLVGGGMAPARRLTPARILLQADQRDAGAGWTDALIAAALAVQPATGARVRQQYVSAGVEAALTPTTPDREYRRPLDGSGGRCGCSRRTWSRWSRGRPSRRRRCARP